jgi:hypothetical protein
VTDYDVCTWCDGTGDAGDWHCRICKGSGMAECWIMEAESMIVGWSECFTDADDFYRRADRRGKA